MRAFRVDFKFKDAGYSHGDEVVSGGSYDTHLIKTVKEL